CVPTSKCCPRASAPNTSPRTPARSSTRIPCAPTASASSHFRDSSSSPSNGGRERSARLALSSTPSARFSSSAWREHPTRRRLARTQLGRRSHRSARTCHLVHEIAKSTPRALIRLFAREGLTYFSEHAGPYAGCSARRAAIGREHLEDKRLGTRRDMRKTASDRVPAWGGAPPSSPRRGGPARAAPTKRGQNADPSNGSAF